MGTNEVFANKQGQKELLIAKSFVLFIVFSPMKAEVLCGFGLKDFFSIFS